MAQDNTTTRILDIQVRYKDAIDQLAAYRKAVEQAQAQQKELKKQLKDGQITQEEYGRKFESTRLFIQQQNQAISTLSRQIQNQEKVQQENLGSLVQWRAEISNMNAEYDRLSQAERESAKGQELRDKIANLTKQLKEAEYATQRFYRNVGNYPGLMGQAGDSTDELVRALTTEAKSADEAANQNEILKKALANIDPEAEGAENAIAELNKKIEENSKVIEEHEAQSEGLIDSMGDLLGVNTNFGKSLESLSKSNAGSFIDGLNVKVKALWQTLLGLLSNPWILSFLGIGAAIGVGKWLYDYNKGLVDATRLTKEFTGLAGDELKAYRNEVQALADMYGKDFQEVLESTNALMKQMGISSQEALDLVKDGFISGADSTGQYLDNVSEFSAYFKEAGISAEQFIAIIAQTNKAGIVSNKALDTIKEANTRIREMSQSTADAFDAIGISSKKVTKELTDGSKTTFEVMQEVSAKLAAMPANSKACAEAIANIFGGPGQDAGYQYITMIKDLNKNIDEVKAQAGDMGRLQEELLAAETEYANSVANLFDLTGGTFEEVTTNIKIWWLKTVASVLNGIKSIIDYISKYKAVFLTLGAVFATVTAAVNAHNIALAFQAVKLKAVALAQKAYNAVLATGRAVVLLLSAAYYACTGSLTKAKGAMVAFNAVCKANPFGLILSVIGAVVAAIEIFGNKTEEAKAKVDALANAEVEATRVKTKATRAVENDIKALENWHGTKKEEKRICDELNKKYGSVLGKYTSVGAWYQTLKMKGAEYIKMLYEQAKAEALVAQAAELRAEAARKRLEGQNADVSWYDQFNHMLEINFSTFEIRANSWSESGERLKEYAIAEANAAATELEQIASEMEKQAESAMSKSNEAALDYLQTLGDMESVLDTINKNDYTAPTPKGDKDKDKNKGGKTPQETEVELVRKAEDELYKIINDAFEARRKQVSSEYDRQIGELKMRLLREKNLTAEEQAAINQQILDLERKKNEAIGAAEAELLRGKSSAYEMQRRIVCAQYDRQIEDYRKKLETDKTLTEKSRTAINGIIISLEKQKEGALKQLFQKQLAEDIEYRKKMIELELAAVKAGSEQEFALKMQQLEAQREAELNNVELTEEMRLAIEEKYRKLSQDLQDQHDQEVWQKQQEKMQARFENENTIRTAQNEQRLAELEMMGASEGQIELQNLWTQHEEQAAALAQMQEELSTMRRADGESQTEFEQRQAAKRQEIATKETQIKQTQAKMQQSAFGSITSAIDAMGEHSKAFAIASKAIALATIAIDTGKALAAGISQAQSVPFPANIAAIATTVATILANVATAISTVKSAKFAEGGKVTGPGTGKSDSIPARLSNGEFVMTARATKMFEPLLLAMNNIGRGVPIQVANSYESVDTIDQMSEAFSDAAREIKPVVSVVEITEAQDRVNMIENLDNY